MRTFELSEGTAHTFWSIEVDGARTVVRYGRIGTRGQEKVKEWGSGDEARREADKLVRSKEAKGYVAVGAPAAEAPPPPAPPTDGVRFEWPAGGVARQLPFRGEVRGAPRAVPDDLLFKGVRAELQEASTAERWRGYAQAPAPLGPLVQAARDRIDGGGEPSDPLVEAAVLVLSVRTLHWGGQHAESDKLSERLVDAWVVTRGLRFAAEAMLATRRFAMPWSLGSWVLVLREHGDATEMTTGVFPSDWLRLRHWACAAGGADHQAVVDLFTAFDEAHRGESAADYGTRVLLALALPEAPLWRDLVAGEPRTTMSFDPRYPLVACDIDPDAARRLTLPGKAAHWVAHYLPTLAWRLRHAAWPVIRDVERPEWMDLELRKSWVRSAGAYVGPEPAELIARELVVKGVRPHVGEYFARHPELALEVLPPLVATGPKALKEGASVVLQAARRALEASAPSAEPARPPVSVGDLPEVLADPPWRRKKVVRVGLPEIDLEPAPLPDEIRWPEGQQEAVLKRAAALRANHWLGDPARVVPWLDRSVEAGEGLIDHLLALRDLERARRTLRAVPRWLLLRPESLAQLVAEFPEELGHILSQVSGRPEIFEGVGMVGSVSLGPAAAAAWGRRKTRSGVQRWMRSFPDHAAAGLLPVATSRDAKAAGQAASALTWLHGVAPDALRAAADHHGLGEPVARWLARDPLLDCPPKPPKRPDWYDPARFPKPTVHGAPIPDEAAAHLVEMLAFSEPDPPYAGVAQVRSALDASSLEVFVEALVDAWSAAGAPNAHQWVVLGLAHLGGDGAARWLARKVDLWATEGSKGKGTLGIQALTLLGSDVALMHIARWTRSARRQWQKDAAVEALDDVAALRGLTPDELEDRTAPDLGLADDGTCVLDYGPRRFHVRFDEALAPYLVDEDNVRLKAVAPARGTDDAAMAKAAKERWAELKKDASMVAAVQTERLERAMATGRRWSGRELRSFLVEHPLVGHLARRLVFGVYDGPRLVRSFRVAEDRSLADLDDEATTLDDDAVTGIVHPIDLDGHTLAAWSDRLTDYAILQPFPQLGRPVSRPTAAEAGARSLDRSKGLMVYTGRLFALRKRGWRMEGEGYGVELMVRDLGDGRRATLSFHPGIDPQHTEMREHELRSLDLSRDLTLGDLHPRDFSELVYDLASLRG